MTGKTGVDLGADLGLLKFFGTVKLPRLAGDYRQAYLKTPNSVRGKCRRSRIGMDPSAAIDSLLDRCNRYLKDTESTVNEVGEALVWIADTYAATDATCQQEFNRKLKAMIKEDRIGGY